MAGCDVSQGVGVDVFDYAGVDFREVDCGHVFYFIL